MGQLGTNLAQKQGLQKLDPHCTIRIPRGTGVWGGQADVSSDTGGTGRHQQLPQLGWFHTGTHRQTPVASTVRLVPHRDLEKGQTLLSWAGRTSLGWGEHNLAALLVPRAVCPAQLTLCSPMCPVWEHFARTQCHSNTVKTPWPVMGELSSVYTRTDEPRQN